MNVSDAASRAFETVERRERDVTSAFTPAAARARDTYFVTAARNGRMTYTQRMEFNVRDGALVDEAGNAVLGYANANAPLAPLQIDAADRAMGAFSDAHVSANGAFVYGRREIDPSTGTAHIEKLTAGYVALARFAPGTTLQSAGPHHLAAPAGVAPHLFGAGDPDVQTQMIERLQEAFMQFDALRAATKAEGGLDKTAMDLLK